MKILNLLKTIGIVAAIWMAKPATAQVIPNTYINIDWQMNIPAGTGFARDVSGWGMNFEGGFFLWPSSLSFGPFVSFHTNFEKIPRRSLDLDDGSVLTTNQKHGLYALPFGVVTRYTWRTHKVVQPYAALKLGACYAEMSSFFYILKSYEDTWGFYCSPEAGFSVFPDADYHLGFHCAVYFSAATNHGRVLTYRMDNIFNIGLRLGISF